MNGRTMVLLISVLILASIGAVASPADADTVPEHTYYCYGDHPTLKPIGSGEATWSFVDPCGGDVMYVVNEDGSVTVDLTGHDHVMVTHTCDGDISYATLVAMHILDDASDDDGVYTVTFYDRGVAVAVAEITEDTVIRDGTPFVDAPIVERDGLYFGGWYTSPTYYSGTEFDPCLPVTADIRVYAEWTFLPGGSEEVVEVGEHTVSIDCSPGLKVDILSSEGGALVFSLSGVDAVDIVWSTLRVVTDGGVLAPIEGVYVLEGIDGDVVIQASAEVAFSSSQETGGIIDSIPGHTVMLSIGSVLAVIGLAVFLYERRQAP